ncbi:hypothetical protein K0M31_000466 [Melipona bicolor]|uniref:Uncharacterized protein n=1 Tax=Melipona bicolor TaxID=60889 RepID=A0AA40GEE0_9HYME|nr:hypothetical protein K0M31_000466 [Melipona bicolor]
MSGPEGGREGGAESTPAISVMLQENTHTVDSLADKSDEPKQRDDQSRRDVAALFSCDVNVLHSTSERRKWMGKSKAPARFNLLHAPWFPLVRLKNEQIDCESKHFLDV